MRVGVGALAAGVTTDLGRDLIADDIVGVMYPGTLARE
jgi:hypothetical protein